MRALTAHPTWTHTGGHHRIDTPFWPLRNSLPSIKATRGLGLQSIVIVETDSTGYGTKPPQYSSTVCTAIWKLPVALGDWKRTALDLGLLLKLPVGYALSMHPTIWHCYVLLPSMRSIETGSKQTKPQAEIKRAAMWMIALCWGGSGIIARLNEGKKILAVNSFFEMHPALESICQYLMFSRNYFSDVTDFCISIRKLGQNFSTWCIFTLRHQDTVDLLLIATTSPGWLWFRASIKSPLFLLGAI